MNPIRLTIFFSYYLAAASLCSCGTRTALPAHETTATATDTMASTAVAHQRNTDTITTTTATYFHYDTIGRLTIVRDTITHLHTTNVYDTVRHNTLQATTTATKEKTQATTAKKHRSTTDIIITIALIMLYVIICIYVAFQFVRKK